MSEYRDELAAAHARIAELEEKVHSLEDAARAEAEVWTGKFPELEAEVARRRERADPKKTEKKRATVAWVSAVFPLIGMTFTFLHLPLFATMCSGVFIALLVYNWIFLTRRMKENAAHLQDAEAKLHDAQRIAELETKLAAKVRVGVRADEREREAADEEMTTEPRRGAV